jgi:hypothetical protein
MTPTEKATELIEQFEKVDTFAMTSRHGKLIPKECALICIEQIENALIDCGELSDQLQNMDRELYFWQNVRKEIESM